MKTRVLTEKVIEANNDGMLTESVVFFPGNGCVSKQVKNEKGEVKRSEILVRLVYANEAVTEVVLEALRGHLETGC